MPARHHQHDPPARLQPREQFGAVPVIQRIPRRPAVRLGPGFHRVVDQDQIRPPPGDRPAHAGGEILRATLQRKPPRRPVGRVETQAELIALLGDQHAQAAAEMPGERRRVTRRDHLARRMAGEPECRKQHRGIGRFRRPRRHLHHQPVHLAARDALQRVDQREVMPFRPLPSRRQHGHAEPPEIRSRFRFRIRPAAAPHSPRRAQNRIMTAGIAQSGAGGKEIKTLC
ncbi:unnamed protein product [Acidocella sp. C78]|nr:unnamed protein product [Acidocella sp. C78]